MSDTPKTDTNCGWPVGHHGRIESSDLKLSPDGPFVHSSVARELERENAALRKAINEADIIFENKREDGRREWWSGGTWVLYNQCVVIIGKDAFNSAKNKIK